MYKHSFINREKELSFLEKAYRSDRAELIVIYGRRRVGKTELVKKAINNKKAILNIWIIEYCSYSCVFCFYCYRWHPPKPRA